MVLGKTVHSSFSSEIPHYKTTLGWGCCCRQLMVLRCLGSQTLEKVCALQELDMGKLLAQQEGAWLVGACNQEVKSFSAAVSSHILY